MVYIFQNQKNYSVYLDPINQDTDYHQNVTNFIKNSVGVNSYSILTITTQDNTGYYSLEYIYALKNLPVYQIPINMDLRGELYYDYNPQKDVSVLICKDFSDYNEVELKCLDVFLYKYGKRQILNSAKINSSDVFVFTNTL